VENLIRLKINAIEIQPLENNENISLKVHVQHQPSTGVSTLGNDHLRFIGLKENDSVSMLTEHKFVINYKTSTIKLS